jgi:hypothetical protein
MFTTTRTITRSLAPLLQSLELEQPRVLTRGDLERLARGSGVAWPVPSIVQRLREQGWLLDLRTRGAWEYAPAARAGAYGSGDPFIELRATLRRDPGSAFAVAADSAAYLLGHSSRRPARDVVALSPGTTAPPALRRYRLVRWRPATGMTLRDDLPVWPATTLVAFMGTRPALFRDWPNVGEWLRAAAADVVIDDLGAELAGRPRSAWARACYLLHRGDRRGDAVRLLADAPVGHGPYYLGDRRTTGRHDPVFDVIDSTGLETHAP